MDGPFQFGTGYRFAEFTDGLSNTLLAGEKQVAVGQHGVGWNDCSIYNGDYFQCSTRAASVRIGLTTDPHDGGWKFGSRHTGVVQFVLGDGHVRSLPTTIRPDVLEALTTRHGGEILPDF
ncbi:MAG: DUF1559 domain-containing protein [Gemmataceae bacterium]|nr:DUF1559 domain-containing protein [Gemmataceae bacterium]